MSEELAKNLEKALKEKKMTQKQLASEAKITEAAVSHYVKGDREPRSGTLAIIAGILGVSAGVLLGQGLESSHSKKKNESFNEIKKLLQEHVSAFSSEEKIELVRILTSY